MSLAESSPMVDFLRGHVHVFVRRPGNLVQICSCGHRVPFSGIGSDVERSWAVHLWQRIETAPELDSSRPTPAPTPDSR